MTILGVTASSIYKLPTAFESISTATGTGSASSVTLSSIPSTYEHLQVRFYALGSAGATLGLRINGDTTANYVRHFVDSYATGTSASGQISITNIDMTQDLAINTVVPLVGIIDIHNYANTLRNKTVRILIGQNDGGINASGTNGICMMTGMRLSTEAISSLTFFTNGANFTTTSQFALYGIRGA